MLKSSARVTLVALAALVLTGAPAAAQVIRLSTGLDAGGVALADGATDPFWKISINAGATFSAAKVLGDSYNILCGCGILPNAPTGKWVNGSGVIASGYPIGPVILHTRTFDLTGYDLASVSLVGSWSVMDGLVGMYLNGVLVPGSVYPYPPNPNWQLLRAFSISGAANFFSGINTLEFRITTVNNTWDGLLLRSAEARGNYTPPGVVPEPATLALLATGLVGIGIVARRRRAAA